MQGFIQCLLTGKLAKTKAAQALKREASILVYGIVSKVPEGQTAEGGIEIHADFMTVFGAVSDDIEQLVNKDCSDEIKVSCGGFFGSYNVYGFSLVLSSNRLTSAIS